MLCPSAEFFSLFFCFFCLGCCCCCFGRTANGLRIRVVLVALLLKKLTSSSVLGWLLVLLSDELKELIKNDKKNYLRGSCVWRTDEAIKSY